MLLNKITRKNEHDFLKKIVESQSDSFFEFSISKFSIFSLDFYTENLLKLLDVNQEQLINIKDLFLKERVLDSDYIKILKLIEDNNDKEAVFNFDFRIRTTSGELKWIQLNAKTNVTNNGSIICYGKLRDITKSKIELEELIVLNARNQFASEASGVGVWDWDLQTNKVFYSKESLQILELNDSNQHLIDNPEKWDERVHPNDREEYYHNIKQHFEGNTPFYETYHRVFCNNKYKWILDKGKVITRDQFGKPLRIVGTHTDVTHLKEKENQTYENLQMVNRQNNKLINFAHIVSHNLRNHTGNLSLLIKMKEDGEFETEEAFGYIKSVSTELNETIHNLMELVKIQNSDEIETQSLNMHQSLLKVFRIISEEISNRNVTIKNNIPKELELEYNPAFLESILLNLTTNAIKYSDKSKEVVIEYTLNESDDYLILNVKDNGLGINLELYKEDVFGLYKTFHHLENSTGIGLYITKNQIESMGGKIEVESKVNVGSTFKVYFKKK